MSPVASVHDIPLDYVPAPRSLPPGSRIVMAHNPYFVGREEELKQLARTFFGSGLVAVHAAATTGLGGIGKTQLASEFAHRYGYCFHGGVFWLSFANPNNIPTEVATCGGPEGLNLPRFNDLEQPDQVAQIQALWREETPRLLIFDNCEEEELLNQWRPKIGGCRVLVTSRRSEWSHSLGLSMLPIKTLTRPDSVRFLRRFLDDIALDDAEAIAAELGDLPLALHLAGNFLHNYRRVITPPAYLAELQKTALLEHPSLMGFRTSHSPTEHELHVGKTFALSWEQLDDKNLVDAAAIHLLQQASYLAPGQPIPPQLLWVTGQGHHFLGRDEASHNAYLTNDGLTRLLTLGLLAEEKNKTLVLHRLLAAYVRGLGKSEVAQAAIQKSLSSIFSDRTHRSVEIDFQSLLIPHLQFVASTLQDNGDYIASQPYYEYALTIQEKILGAEHSDTANILNELALLLQAIGDYQGARPYYERVLAIREKVLGIDHPDTIFSREILDRLLQAIE